MSRPAQLLVEVRGELGHLPRARAVDTVASRHKITSSGVSGMVSKAERDAYAILELIRYQAQHITATTPAQKRADAITADGLAQIARHRERIARTYRRKLATAVFMSDVHLPAADWRALKLAYKIIEVTQPVYISAINDALDYAGLGRHVDNRSAFEKAFDGDVSNSLQMAENDTRARRLLAKNALQIAIGANHDSRIKHRDYETGAMVAGDTLAALAMEQLAAAGVVFEAHITHENVFRINDGLAWMHGMTAAANPSGRVKKNFGYAQRLHGQILTDLVSGHIHKHGMTRHPDLPGVHLYESGKLCKDDMSYLRHSSDWTTGIVISRFDPNSRYHDTQLIRFDRRGDGWFCVVDGKTYSA